MFPAPTTASAVPSLHGPAREEERALALLADGVGRLLVHGDDLLGVDDLQAAGERLEHLGPAEQDRSDVAGRGRLCARHDRFGRPIAAHGVDRNPDGLRCH